MSDKDIKNNLTMILESFHSFCMKNELRYYIAGGTCLGAYRHKGFIPWDDDIDVYMPRPDYDKFIDLYTKQSLQNRYKLYCLETNNSPYPFAKLEDSFTKIVNARTSLHKSVWIDIFPLDGVKIDELKLLRKAVWKIKIYGNMLEWACVEKPQGNIIIRMLKKILINLIRLKGCKYYGMKIRMIASRYSYDDYENIANLTWGYGLKEIIPKTDIFPLKDVLFENIIVKAPHCDNYLKKVYGDYMQLPPVEKRISHHIEAVLLDCKKDGE